MHFTRPPTTATCTSVFQVRPSAIRIWSCVMEVDNAMTDSAAPAKGSPTVAQWAESQRFIIIISRSWDRPRCRIAVARPRASFTRLTPFTPATKYVWGFKSSTFNSYVFLCKKILDSWTLELLKGAEEDQDWKDDEPRMGRLRQRRGRTIVHRSLEDNYGAVVVANHEALAQFLEQVYIVCLLLLHQLA